MSGSIQRFLQIVADGKWHVFNELPHGIGVGTINQCISQGFVRTKKTDRHRLGDFESYRIALRITARGQRVLQ